MTTLHSMIGNLTLPYGKGAYLQEIELGYFTDHGLTPFLDYSLDNYAIRFGVALWDIQPLYLVAPRFEVGDEPLCLFFGVLGWPQDQYLPQVRIPAHTPVGVPFIIPLGADANGLTRLTHLREWPEPPPGAPEGRQRWQVLVLVGNLGRLLWALAGEKASLHALARQVGGQRFLSGARGYSLDLIGQELRVPRGFPSAYDIDPATLALYHLDDLEDDPFGATTVGDRVIDATGRHHGVNEDAERGAQGRFYRCFGFRSGQLPRPNCAAEEQFQQRLRAGDWDAEAGEREVRYGPYRVYGYREGAIEVPGPDGQPHGVWVNDEAEDPTVRGMLTSACYGFVPLDLEPTIQRMQELGRSIEEAINYFGRWWGRSSDWFEETYRRYGVAAPYEACPFPAAPLTYVRIPNHRSFALYRNTSFTVEAFIRPTPTQDVRLRVIAAKTHELFFGAPMEVHCVEGWTLTLGAFNCIPNNLAFSISDQPDPGEGRRRSRLVTLTADLDLGDGQWHHVAGVIDRRYQVARLYVDGVERACADISSLGEIINDEDILLGVNDYHFDAPYDGLIDEVRLSNVARRSFHPALGESDRRYRARLSLYRPWVIPTYEALRQGVRHLLQASPYEPDVPAPPMPDIDLVEQDSLRVCAEQLLRFRPLSLSPGEHIDLEGDREKCLEEACGPEDEHFYEWQLIIHNHPGIDYATWNARCMQLAAARSLDNLARLLAPWQALSGARLEVLSAYQPGGDPLEAVGRVLWLRLDGMPIGVLAAFAHKACFDWVEHSNQYGGSVLAAVRQERDKLEIVTQAEATAENWPEREAELQIELGNAVELRVARPIPPDARHFRWLVVECGPGRGELQVIDGGNDRRSFVPLRPGLVFIKVEYTWQGTTISGQRPVRILPHELPPCESIGGDGALGVSEAQAAGLPEGFFHEAFLLEYNDPFGWVAWLDNDHRVQLCVEKKLKRLVDLILQETGGIGGLYVRRGYNPTAHDLHRLGRKLVMFFGDPALISNGRLAALAHAAGFDWVYHPPYPGGIEVACGPDPMLEIVPGPIERLAPNAAINWAGILRADVPEAPVLPGESFNAADPANYHDRPERVQYADATRAHLMHPALQTCVDRLLDRLAEEGAAGFLHILGAFENTAPNRRQVGMGVTMRHDTVPLARLGALAYAVGFHYVRHVTTPGTDPATHFVYASVWRMADFAGVALPNIAEIVDYGLLDLSDYAEAPEGGVRRLCLRPNPMDWRPPAPLPGEAEPPLSYRSPLPEAAHLEWCLTRYGAGLGRLDSSPASHCKWVTALHAAVVGARGEFVLGDASDPYRFDVVVRPNKQGAIPPLPRSIYDDLMNYLEFRRPVGVEGRTWAVRAITPSLMADPQLREANTERTYPVYRQRQPTAPRPPLQAGWESVPCACPSATPASLGRKLPHADLPDLLEEAEERHLRPRKRAIRKPY